MASKNKITEMIASIKTIYPYYAKDADVITLVKTWEVLLKDFTDEVVNVAFYKCLQTCKMPPTPADVLEVIRDIEVTSELSDEMLWNEFTRTLQKVNTYCYRIQYPLYGENPREQIQAVWDSLDYKLQQYIGSKGEMMRLAQTYTDEELKFEKTRFMKAMPIMQKRKEYQKFTLLLGGSETAIGKLTE